jgi:hypothetical protein
MWSPHLTLEDVAALMQPKCPYVTALTEKIAAKLLLYFYQFKGIPQATNITALTCSVA